MSAVARTWKGFSRIMIGRATRSTTPPPFLREWRNKANVRATLFVWGEVDFKDHEPDIKPDEIVRCLNNIPLRPTFFVFSGHGIHLYWMLKEEEDASPGDGQRRIEGVLRLIA